MAAEPEAESDPAVLLKTNPYIYNPTFYNRGIFNPYYSTGLTYATPTSYINPFYRFKREAEAEADPAVLLKTNPYMYGTTLYNRGIFNPYFSTGVTYAAPTSYISPFYRFKREAESDPNLVYTDGVFHTNVENLNKGIHLNKAMPYGSIYKTIPTYNKFVTPAVYPGYSAFPSMYSSYIY